MANENIRIDNVELNWARLATPFKNQFGGENYELQIIVDADRKDELESAGLKTRMLEDGRVSANLKRKAMKASGEANEAPRVVDAQRQPLPADKVRSIGNGSTGNVIVYKFDYTFGGNSGVSHSLTAVQVTDFVEYSGSVDFDAVEASEASEAAPF